MNHTEPVVPIAELPAHRLMESSAEYLTDSDLLSLVIHSGAPARALSVSRRLIGSYGSLKAIAAVPVAALTRIEGVGTATACAIHAALELARRLNGHVAPGRTNLQGPEDVAEHFHAVLSGRKQEEFHVALLDTKHRLIRSQRVTIGLLDRSQIDARAVFAPAIAHAASRVILVHQHPSGDPTPSAQDISCTRNLVEAGKIVGIEVLDHVIVGERTASRPKYWLSFREENLL